MIYKLKRRGKIGNEATCHQKPIVILQHHINKNLKKAWYETQNKLLTKRQ